MIPRKSGHPQVEFGVPGDVAGRRTGDRVLEALAALATIPAGTGPGFFHDCVLLLTSAYDVEHAFIATFADDARSRMSTLAVWKHGKPAENFEYELAGSPCFDVIAHEYVFIPCGAVASYPGAGWLAELAVDGYYGAALSTSSGQKRGVVVVARDHPRQETNEGCAEEKGYDREHVHLGILVGVVAAG